MARTKPAANDDNLLSPPIGIRLPKDVYQAVEAMAREEDRPIAAMARRLLTLGLEQLKAKTNGAKRA